MPKEGAAGGLRFVLLRHEVGPVFAEESGRGSHFDLLLQRHAIASTEERALLAWSLDANPFAAVGKNLGEVLVAEKLPDHRARYLTYEGEIDGDRGRVRRVAEGNLAWQHSSCAEYQAELHGEYLSGNTTHEIQGRLCLQCCGKAEWRTIFWPNPAG